LPDFRERAKRIPKRVKKKNKNKKKKKKRFVLVVKSVPLGWATYPTNLVWRRKMKSRISDMRDCVRFFSRNTKIMFLMWPISLTSFFFGLKQETDDGQPVVGVVRPQDIALLLL
jgi:hypothetical protein